MNLSISFNLENNQICFEAFIQIFRCISYNLLGKKVLKVPVVWIDHFISNIWTHPFVDELFNWIMELLKEFKLNLLNSFDLESNSLLFEMTWVEWRRPDLTVTGSSLVNIGVNNFMYTDMQVYYTPVKRQYINAHFEMAVYQWKRVATIINFLSFISIDIKGFPSNIIWKIFNGFEMTDLESYTYTFFHYFTT